MNNNYKQPIPNLPMEEKAPVIEPLSGMMARADQMLGEALQMAYAINNHMFGKGEPNNEKPCEPRCYRDVMETHVMNLENLCDELSKIMDSIGV